MNRLTLFTVLLFLHSSTHAADKQIQGTVKTTDADGGSITLTSGTGASERQDTFDVLKKAKIVVNGQAGSLQDVRSGHKVVATLNTELETITSLAATGDGQTEPELLILNELPNQVGNQSAPWLSQDGLTLYWKSKVPNETQSWIWTASRKSKDDLFDNLKRHVPGNDPTVTSDGLEMIVIQQQSLFACKRTSLDATFSRPQKISELEKFGFLGSPCLSGDGLTMHADQIDFAAKTVTPVRFERASRAAKWGKRQVLKVSGLNNRRIRFLSVTEDKQYLFCSVYLTTNYEEEPVLAALSADAEDGSFSSPRPVMIHGKMIKGKFPRYLASTHELFFARFRPGLKSDELVVIKNLNVESLPILHLDTEKK